MVRRRDLAEASPEINVKKWRELVSNHTRFLANGGSEGTWQVLSAAGVHLALYESGHHYGGEQASFERKKIPAGFSAEGANLPWANLSSAMVEQVNFAQCDLSHSLATDSYFRGSDFSGANLTGVDFSRSDLRDCNFSGANLTGADFENVDVSGSDFTGAILEGARFPGANLAGVKV